MNVLSLILNSLYIGTKHMGLENTPTASLQRNNASTECPRYGIKQSDYLAPVLLEFRRRSSSPSLP